LGIKFTKYYSNSFRFDISIVPCLETYFFPEHFENTAVQISECAAHMQKLWWYCSSNWIFHLTC